MVTPIDFLSTRYDISNVGLAKICRRYDVPVPPRGHWQKHAAGLPTSQPRLPKRQDSATDTVVTTLAPRHDAAEGELVPCAAIRTQRAYEDDPAQRILVTSPLSAISRVHPLVRQTAAALRKTKQVDRGLRRVYGEAILDVSVAPEQVDRAMCVMNALITALDARGFPVTSRAPRPVRYSDGRMLTWPRDGRTTPQPCTCVRVGDQDVLLQMREHRTKIDRQKVVPDATAARARPGRQHTVIVDPYPAYDLVGSGRLVLQIPHHVGGWGAVATWTEGPRLRLEDVLNDIIVGIFAATEEFCEVIAHWANDAREREELAQRAHLEQQQRAAEAARIQKLEQAAANWTKARDLRVFLAAVRAAGTAAAAALTPAGMSPDEWLQWAEKHADTLDPLTHEP